MKEKTDGVKKSNWRRIFPMELGNKGEEDVVKIENR